LTRPLTLSCEPSVSRAEAVSCLVWFELIVVIAGLTTT